MQKFSDYMPTRFLASACILLSALSGGNAFADPPKPPISVCEVTQNRNKYNATAIIVEGVVTSVKTYHKAAANEYTIGQLKDLTSGCYVRIFMRHRPTYQGSSFIQTGSHVSMLGFYYKTFPYWGHSRVQNEIHPAIYYIRDCEYDLLGTGWTVRSACSP